MQAPHTFWCARSTAATTLHLSRAFCSIESQIPGMWRSDRKDASKEAQWRAILLDSRLKQVRGLAKVFGPRPRVKNPKKKSVHIEYFARERPADLLD